LLNIYGFEQKRGFLFEPSNFYSLIRAKILILSLKNRVSTDIFLSAGEGILLQISTNRGTKMVFDNTCTWNW